MIQTRCSRSYLLARWRFSASCCHGFPRAPVCNRMQRFDVYRSIDLDLIDRLRRNGNASKMTQSFIRMTRRKKEKKRKNDQSLKAHRKKLVTLTISGFYANFIFASWNKIVIERFINRIIRSVIVATNVRQTNVRMNWSWQLEAVPINSINWNA